MAHAGWELEPDVMPKPAVMLVHDGLVHAPLDLSVKLSGVADPRIQGAVARAQARWRARMGGTGAQGALVLDVTCDREAPGFPTGSEDESYTLELRGLTGSLHAATALGVLHGLETLLQLPKTQPEGTFLSFISINDSPRFKWRGLLIDVARHWEPTEVLLRNIDAMAVVKLNVLHLHLSDDQGFRIESRTHPELQAQGSDGNFFTQAQMRSIIAYAAERGIRVLPEFDVPGHTTSWLVSHPELASLPGPYAVERHWGVFNPVMDPTQEATYSLLSDFLGEMAELFPIPFIHIGGDENNGVQWNANPRIQAFIREKGLKDNAGLHAYFNRRIDAILAKHGKRVVGWDEILNPELPRDCVIHSWRGAESLAEAANMGFDGLLSNGYYIDLCYPASAHYLQDPIPDPSKLTAEARAHILGGEATMWGEFVAPETIDSRIWPRTAAIAERLWSPASVRDVPDMYRRLSVVSRRLTEAGALHEANTDVMLRHLVGANLDAPGVSSLRTFLSVIEPFKRYDRIDRQIWMSQLVPLIGIADAAKPESEASRRFAADVDAALFAAGGVDKARLAALAQTLSTWRASGIEVADKMAPTYPGLREAIAKARGLADSCAAAADAIDALVKGTAFSPARTAAALATMDNAAKPDLSATLIPALAPMRLLVGAAAIQARRAGLSDEYWQDQVIAAGNPGLAEAAPGAAR